MQQFVPRIKPTYNGQALVALSIGTAVKAGSISGSFTPITADSDAWIGIVTADVQAGDKQATIAVRGGGQVLSGKLGSPCNFGQALYLDGATATFVSSSANQVTIATGSIILTSIPVAGYALSAGITGDLIDVILT